MTFRLARFAIALLIAAPAGMGCDLPSEEQRRTEIESITSEKLGPVVTAQENNADTIAKEQERITTLERQLADLSAQAVALESQLALAQTRIDALETAQKAPPTPTPTVRPGRPDPAAYYKVDIGDSATLGPDTALVTIVTWSDFQCPFCKRVSPTIDQLRKDYGDDIRYVFKHNPLAFHNEAKGAAHAAEAAHEQGKFWEMHDRLFENGRSLSDANYRKWAKELGLNIKQFDRDRASSEIATRVSNDAAAGIRLGARGTPAFFVNGRFLSGAQPVASFKVLIDEEMKHARAKVAAGTARKDVYEATVAGGKTAP